MFTTHGYVWGRGKATQEGYSGASAWYGNYDSRVSTLKQNFTEEQMDTYFPGLNDEQITETLQSISQPRLLQVLLECAILMQSPVPAVSIRNMR